MGYSFIHLFIMCIDTWARMEVEVEHTNTSSKVIYVVPEGQTPEQFICLVVRPGAPLSMRSREMPPMPGPPVLTATVKKSEKTPLVIHFFSPLTM